MTPIKPDYNNDDEDEFEADYTYAPSELPENANDYGYPADPGDY